MPPRRDVQKQLQQQALARLYMRRAYNVNPWPFLGGVLAALFAIGFTLFAISRERAKDELRSTPNATRDRARAPEHPERSPGSADERPQDEAEPKEQWIWIE